MIYIITYLFGVMMKAYTQYEDPRLQHLPLISSIVPMVCTIVAYLAFVLHYGPQWMKNRAPFKLSIIMRCYNAIQVIVNLVLFLPAGYYMFFYKKFSLVCQPVDKNNTEPEMMALIYITYGYYLTKYFDLLDTVFIILRKKNQQVSFLHVYHHAGMILAVFFHSKFMAGSHSTMLGFINLFIHTVMYSYYFVSSVRPVKTALWWKRYITQLQLLQFGYLMFHYFLAIARRDCTFPKPIAFIGLIQNLFMFALFFDFYYKAYLRKSKKVGLQQTLKSEQLLQAELSVSNATIQSDGQRGTRSCKTNGGIKLPQRS